MHYYYNSIHYVQQKTIIAQCTYGVVVLQYSPGVSVQKLIIYSCI